MDAVAHGHRENMTLPTSFARAGAVAAALACLVPACQGAEDTGAGDPCTPALEKRATFGSFDESEVVIDTGVSQCAMGVCLINHFRGRVTCPYGQDRQGAPPSGASPCVVPGGGAPVAPADPRGGEQVRAQCTDRTTEKAVYCSCRCANVEGRNDDGAPYCDCPSGFACTQLVSSIGAAGDRTSGAYCMKEGTAYDRSNACAAACDPQTATCPS